MYLGIHLVVYISVRQLSVLGVSKALTPRHTGQSYGNCLGTSQGLSVLCNLQTKMLQPCACLRALLTPATPWDRNPSQRVEVFQVSCRGENQSGLVSLDARQRMAAPLVSWTTPLHVTAMAGHMRLAFCVPTTVGCMVS